ncbi:hypothetical protein EJP82_10320 [Paenibacillus anaericanus]|uniref:Uncharacterized protein n=1 Tax=Paenibacillus anaericanus TaxID=170367 RepID=A0A3S1K9A6_9BACL|nr:hypothetical protein [Paenibacillus anaericanus]RUT46801.1 hypothetical protein EJP82_10320 [Paenibacillus anaericanus]
MATTKAKKLRQKLAREGKRNPELSRSPFATTDMRTRRTKTKLEQLSCIKHRNHDSIYGDDGSFLFSGSGSPFISVQIS